MKTKALATAALAMALAHSAHSASVERAYTARVTSSTPSTSSAAKIFQIGDEIVGFFKYDDSLVGAPRPPKGYFPSHEYAYSGTVQNNHITAMHAGIAIVGTPAPDEASCSPLDLSCQRLPTVLARDDATGPLGNETDMLRLFYSLPLGGGVWQLGQTRVSSIQMKFVYPGVLPNAKLPTQISLDQLAYAELALYLTDGTNVIARVSSMSVVPEPGTSALTLLGLSFMAALARKRSSHGTASSSAHHASPINAE